MKNGLLAFVLNSDYGGGIVTSVVASFFRTSRRLQDNPALGGIKTYRTI